MGVARAYVVPYGPEPQPHEEERQPRTLTLRPPEERRKQRIAANMLASEINCLS